MPILYKFAMHSIELHVTNLDIDTTILTWTGMADHMFVSCLSKSGARVLYKYILKSGHIHSHVSFERTKQVLIKECRLVQPSLVSPQSSFPPLVHTYEFVQCNCHAPHLMLVSYKNWWVMPRHTLQSGQQWHLKYEQNYEFPHGKVHFHVVLALEVYWQLMQSSWSRAQKAVQLRERLARENEPSTRLLVYPASVASLRCEDAEKLQVCHSRCCHPSGAHPIKAPTWLQWSYSIS